MCGWCVVLKMINPGLTFFKTKISNQEIQGNNKSRDNWCRFNFHSLNRICSETLIIEYYFLESESTRNNRSKFHCSVSYLNHLGFDAMSSFPHFTKYTFWQCIQRLILSFPFLGGCSSANAAQHNGISSYECIPGIST